MKVLLLAPPMFIYRGYCLNLNPPLGIMYLATKLREKHIVAVWDCEALMWDYKKILVEVNRFKPDVLGITATSWSYHSVPPLCKLLKKAFPKMKIVLGGPHVTVAKEEVLAETGADTIVIGESENIAEDIVSTSEKILIGSPVEDLNFFPSWDLLSPPISSSSYIGNDPRYSRPETVSLWSRGCPHDCLFCCNPIFQHRPTRFRKEENILEELEILQKKYGIRSVFVYDDELIGMNKFQTKWLKNICQGIIERGLHLDLKCQGRCNPKVIDEELLQLMNKAGFRAIMLGCESGSDKVLKAIHKGITVSDIEETVKMVHNAGIDPWTFFMVGNMEETLEDVELTKELIQRLKPYIKYRQVTVCTPWRGSKLYEIAKERNWIEDYDLSHYTGDYAVMHTDWMTREEMQKAREYLLRV